MRTRHAVRTFAGSALPLPHASCPCAQRFVSLCQRHVRHLRREIAVSVRKWVSSKLAERNSKRDRWNFRNVTGSFAPGKLRENDEIAICIFIINVLRDFHQLRVTPSWRAGVPVSFFSTSPRALRSFLIARLSDFPIGSFVSQEIDIRRELWLCSHRKSNEWRPQLANYKKV